MPNLLDHFRHGLTALGWSEPRRPTLNVHAGKPEILGESISLGFSDQAFEGFIGKQYLQLIVAQVSDEGFHVESLAIFRNGNLKPSDSIIAIEHWARRNGLKVAMNHEHGICFFEKI